MRVIGLAAMGLVFGWGWLACGGDDTSSTDDGDSSGTGAGEEATIGPEGGTVTSADGVVRIAIPASALAEEVTITIGPASSPPAGALGEVVEIGPSGTTFATPVRITFVLDGVDLRGRDASEVRVATGDGGAWQLLGAQAQDGGEVSGEVSHLSPFGLVAPVCGPDAGSFSCPASGPCPPAPTCASSDPCARLPGSAVESCTDRADGWDASCCFAPADPACATTSGGASCPAEGPCPPAPTCADAGSCEGIAGSSMESCTDLDGGWTAVCCLPPGTPLPDAPSGGDTGGTPPGG